MSISIMENEKQKLKLNIENFNNLITSYQSPMMLGG